MFDIFKINISFLIKVIKTSTIFKDPKGLFFFVVFTLDK